MKTNKGQEERFLISFADIVLLLRKSKKTILTWALIVGFLGMTFALLKPIQYEAEGTFREKGVKTNNVATSSVLQLLSGASFVGAESEAASMMTSRRILKEVIDKLHLQGDLSALSDIETPSKLITRNLSLAWAGAFRRSPKPVLEELCCPLKIETLRYTGEIPLSFRINLLLNGDYEVSGGGFKGVRQGKLGEPFVYDQLSFTLAASNYATPLVVQSYELKVNSLFNTAAELCKVLKVDLTKFDKSLLKMKCLHRDRNLASAIVNATMDSYQNYLKGYHAEVATNQLEYLNERRDQLTKHLNVLMQRHADFLSDDLSNSGFMEASKEMDFLAISQHEYKQKMLDNELEIKRLRNIDPGHLAYYQRYSTNEGDPTYINTMLSEMRSLKQQRDALEIELQKKSVAQGANLRTSFDHQLEELKDVQQQLIELQKLIDQVHQGSSIENLTILNDPRFLLTGWLERVEQAKAEGPSNLQETQENFHYYLSNLARSFGVHERILLERLTHQQNPSGEYKGITLEVATNLYLDYSKQLVQMEGTIRQNLFLIHQIEDPHFEITSLSSGLDDEVSQNMIRKASELVLNLKDQNNQSLKEQERIKAELNLQRTFLTMHLKQMVQLMELNKQLIDEKIFALENVSLELIHEKISLLEKNLQDYLISRLNNLQQEKTLIQRHLDHIHEEMASLPQKWVSEQLLSQEVETNQKIVEEIAKLVESKNISHNLDVIQSAPIDVAIPPVHPLIPKVFLLGFLGFLLGGMMGSGYVLGRTFKHGMAATAENMRLMGFHVSGTLNGSSSDRETLRQLQTYVEAADENDPKVVLLLEGEGPHYASELADLLLKRGKKVLTLDLNCRDSHKITPPGLMQVLEGTMQHLPIWKGKQGDWMSSGGATPYAIEMIQSPAFSKLMDQLKEQYDWILAFSSLPPTSGEGASLLASFPCAAITLTDETIEEIKAVSRAQELCPQAHFTFIFSMAKQFL